MAMPFISQSLHVWLESTVGTLRCAITGSNSASEARNRAAAETLRELYPAMVPEEATWAIENWDTWIEFVRVNRRRPIWKPVSESPTQSFYMLD
jgi:hypothetical protein